MKLIRFVNNNVYQRKLELFPTKDRANMENNDVDNRDILNK